jgi:RNAse (barnase) inhibitor barstar
MTWIPTERERHTYLFGYCHFLALAIHEKTGWPMMAWVDSDEIPTHVCVETPEGLLLDIDGIRSSEQMMRELENEFGTPTRNWNALWDVDMEWLRLASEEDGHLEIVNQKSSEYALASEMADKILQTFNFCHKSPKIG